MALIMFSQLFRKCCFCIPLRRGLLVWGYAKLIFTFLVILQLVTAIFFRTVETSSETYSKTEIFMKILSTALPDVLDFSLTIVLIIAAHKKNLKMMQVYYYYTITMLAVCMLVTLLSAFDSERFEILYNMMFQYTWLVVYNYYEMLITSVVFILLQAYLMLLVRAEFNKIYNSDFTKEKIARKNFSASFEVIGTPPSSAKPVTEVVNITIDDN